MSIFGINFFELAFLAESCIPPVPIARSSFFDNLSTIHYHCMTKEERKRLYELLLPKLDISNEDCNHFIARFNPDNQFEVELENKKYSTYKYNGNYHVDRNTYINLIELYKIKKL